MGAPGGRALGRAGGTGLGKRLKSGTDGELLLLRPVRSKKDSDLETTFSKALGGTSEVCPQGMGQYGSQGLSGGRVAGSRRSERQRTGPVVGMGQ